MGANPQTKGSRAGIIASAAIGMVIFIVGVFFAGLAIGYSMVPAGGSSRSTEEPTAEPSGVSEDGSTMELFDSEGESIGTLHRAGRAVGTPAPKEG